MVSFPELGNNYGYESRFLEFSLEDMDQAEENGKVGLYDTKERKVFLSPSAQMFLEWDEDEIEVFEPGDAPYPDCRVRYINSKGDNKYPWRRFYRCTAIRHWSDSRLPSSHNGHNS